ncbi:unnamed protein product [Schistocephalus solidus]|uniref:TIR domain-containing protein n=1 Tax=Schistocephalus solidus TaxID=70667 RepID=A0A183TB52_SCHSO|nr:unnamed protein product [Schistocephalus solidus]
MVVFIATYDIGIRAFSVDARCEAAITEFLDTHVKEREDTSCCLFTSKMNSWENAIQALMQLRNSGGFYDNKCSIYVSITHLWPDSGAIAQRLKFL